MESNNQSFQELPSESSQIAASEQENSTDRELNDLDLDAIAGGYAWYDPLNWTQVILDNGGFDPRIVYAVAGKKAG